MMSGQSRSFQRFGISPSSCLILKVRTHTEITVLFGNFSQMADPPLLGTPYSKKKFIVYFAFQTLRNIFGFHQKVKILPFLLHLLLGIGDPPPHTSQIPKTPFFPPEMNEIWHAKKHLVNLQKFWELGRPPPPLWEKFPNNPVIFF